MQPGLISSQKQGVWWWIHIRAPLLHPKCDYSIILPLEDMVKSTIILIKKYFICCSVKKGRRLRHKDVHPALFRALDTGDDNLFIFLAMSAIEEFGFYLKADLRWLTDTEIFSAYSWRVFEIFPYLLQPHVDILSRFPLDLSLLPDDLLGESRTEEPCDLNLILVLCDYGGD
uniref:Uncharacterized protein n=1 Tax=Lepeophtheirus salmonis TaxID=72036 RepID=A0A0K2TSH0_LEPSM